MRGIEPILSSEPWHGIRDRTVPLATCCPPLYLGKSLVYPYSCSYQEAVNENSREGRSRPTLTSLALAHHFFAHRPECAHGRCDQLVLPQASALASPDTASRCSQSQPLFRLKPLSPGHFAARSPFASLPSRSASDPGRSHREGAGSDARSPLNATAGAKGLRAARSQFGSQPHPNRRRHPPLARQSPCPSKDARGNVGGTKYREKGLLLALTGPPWPN